MLHCAEEGASSATPLEKSADPVLGISSVSTENDTYMCALPAPPTLLLFKKRALGHMY